ncbi:hypothetical protein DL764_010662 [Monosporascus ibericus]|uniref:B box-type domain-containing protein n=1 Tax=Monosporascus ibericus TaxID=155417 RepID=A0A4Q4SUS4_9PEZI|nr:hypothetical protein DL764_010662 [Monosporascus ibericus]
MSAEAPTSPGRASSGHTVSGSSSGMGGSSEEPNTYPDGSSLGFEDGRGPYHHAPPVGDTLVPDQGNVIPCDDDEAQPMDVDTPTSADKGAPVSIPASTPLASQHRHFKRTWKKNQTCDICNRQSPLVKLKCLECALITCKSCYDLGHYDKRHNLSGLVVDWKRPPPPKVRRGGEGPRDIISERGRRRLARELARERARHHFNDLPAASEAVAVDSSSAGNTSQDQGIIEEAGQARAVRQGRTALPNARPRLTASSSGGAVLPVAPRPARDEKGLSDALEMLHGAAILESLRQGIPRENFQSSG